MLKGSQSAYSFVHHQRRASMPCQVLEVLGQGCRAVKSGHPVLDPHTLAFTHTGSPILLVLRLS